MSARCRSCKELPDAALPRPQDANEDNLRWWCLQYGVSIPKVAVPSLYLKMHGVPAGLDELVASLRAAV